MNSPKDPNPGTFLDAIEVVTIAEDTVDYESPCLGQHGISLLLKARFGGVEKRTLMDVGQNPEALLKNFSLLGEDPKDIDAVVITHCHYDHTQGLVEVLKAIGKRDIPVVAHPSIFRLNFITSPFLRHVGVMSGDAEPRIREAGGTLYLSADPLAVMPGLFTTGEISRTTDYEEVGIGGLSTIEDGRVKPDGMADDLSIVAKVRGQAPLVLTGCSHAGIVNILKQAASMCGTKEFSNVIGGFHLVEASDERIEKTCEGLAGFKLRKLTPGHCTGFRAQAAMYSRFGAAFTPLRTGMRIRVAAD